MAEPTNYDQLVASLRSGSNGSETAVGALIVAGAPAVPYITQAIQRSTDPLLQVQLVNTLGEMGSSAAAATPLLERLVREGAPHLSAAATAALESIRSPKDARVIRSAQDWEEWWRENRVEWRGADDSRSDSSIDRAR